MIPSRLRVGLASAFLFASLVTPGFAFTPANSASSATLLTVSSGHSVGGAVADSAGNVYYFDSDFTFGDADGDTGFRLIQHTPLGQKHTLQTFSSGLSGNYTIALQLVPQATGVQLYYGEGNGGGLYRSFLPTGATAFSSTTQLGTFGYPHGVYSLKFAPGGTPYLNAYNYDAPVGDYLYRVSFESGPVVLGGNGSPTVLGPTTDYSGAMDFDTEGNLYYAVPGSDSTATVRAGIYRIPASVLAAATTPFALSLDWLVLDTDAYFGSTASTYVGYMEYAADGYLYATVANELYRFHFEGGFSAELLGTPGGFDYFTGLDLLADGLLVSTNAGVFQAVPEPGSIGLLCLGFLSLVAGRRRPRLAA